MTMCYEALELGLSTCMVGIVNQKKVHEYFEIPEERTVRLVLAVGYAPEETVLRKKVRKGLEEVCSYNHW